ncbi:MAG: hypothetical protein JWM05_374, partial [Acidimicrobiales bacterium]|nr:hypothetical protein [Acidimicrobiales bacterium]
MSRDEAAVGLTDQLTDTHLAERARFGESFAMRELYRRHAATVAAFTTAVTGRPNEAAGVVVQAFPEALQTIASGTYSLEDPFVPCLLHTARAIALTSVEAGPADAAELARSLDPDVDLAAVARLFDRTDDTQRAGLFLSAVTGLDAVDIGLALDLPPAAADALVASAQLALGDHLDAAVAALSSLAPSLGMTVQADAFATWRRWAEADTTAHVVGGVAKVPFVVRIEPTATRVLRGAAAAVFLAGMVVAFGDHGSGGSGPVAAGGPGHHSRSTLSTPEGTARIDLASSSRTSSTTTTGGGTANLGPAGAAGATGSLTGAGSGAAGTVSGSAGGGGVTVTGTSGGGG